MPATRTPPLPSVPAPASLGPVLPIALARGCTTLVCVPEGATLRTRQGCLAVQEGPLVCGQVLVGVGPDRLLAAGEGWQGLPGSGAHWLRITALQSSHAQLEEPVPAPGWMALAAGRLARALAGLQRFLAARPPAEERAARLS
ncbi:hypothetical protein [Paracidovorax wautersii]|uniref:Uncharacterized protein n=1 Tax=Paracidovorax wautersii TaxID=1177982 RepID=A0A1I2HG17_9BURK|nr:hypothetical protein [Paracidovorax wautersii]SFF28343.1 hypothetical protein SAMN04489711_12262 [Paracidovorax wautersii]